MNGSFMPITHSSRFSLAAREMMAADAVEAVDAHTSRHVD
jgi:hypothetical protein